MQRARLTRRRIVLGIALIIIGIVILDRTFLYRGLQTSFENIPLFTIAVFISSVTIVFGGVVMGGIPIKEFLKSTIVVGLWVFLFLLPLFILPLPPEVPPVVGSFSLLLLALMFVCYEKWKKKHRKSAEKKGE